MRNHFFLSLILVLAAALSPSAHADAVKIGAVLPLSGEYEFAGASFREGMRLGLEEYGPTKHTYQLILEDSAFVPTRAVLAAQRLISVEKVDVITSMWGPTAMAVGPLSDAQKVVHLANDWEPRWTRDHPYTVNLGAPSYEYVRLQTAMLKQWGAHRVAFIQENSADWSFAAPLFLKALQSTPSLQLVSHETFNKPVRDFRSMLSKIKETRPDVLVVWSTQPESQIILRHAKQVGLTCRMTGYFEDFDEPALVGNTSFIRFNSLTDDFIEHYKARFHKKPLSYTGAGYDQITAIIYAYETFDRKPSAMDIINAMTHRRPWMGAEGRIVPQPSDRFLTVPLQIVCFQDGQMIPSPDFADLNKELGW